MAIVYQDQGTVGLGGSRIQPAETYVRQPVPDASSGFEQLAKALGGLGQKFSIDDQQAKADQEKLDAEKVPYWTSQFAQEIEAGVVDEVQIGKRLPTQSKIIQAKVLEGVGAQQWEGFARDKMEEALRNDATIRTDPVKRKSFFDGLRQEMLTATNGREFYGAGATRAVEGVINEFEGNFQREGATEYQKTQEGEIGSQYTDLLKYGQATGEHGALLDFISKPESGGNYNAYYGNSGNTETKFTDMSIGQVLDWQKKYVASGSESSAVGKYQFINSTLDGLVKKLNIDPNTKFTPELQDALATQLLKDRGLDDFLSGKLSKEEFGNSLAKEWAGLPLVSGQGRGRSAYAGDGLNKSGVSTEAFLSALDKRGPSAEGVLSFENVLNQTSGVSKPRRRELLVESGITAALTSRDPSILDRIPQDFLLDEHKLKIEKAREDITNLKWSDYVRGKQIKDDQSVAERTAWENDLVTRYAKQQPIDLYKDSLGTDGQVDAKKRDFLLKMQETTNISQSDSSLAAANLKDGLYTAATSGNYSSVLGNDIVLGPIIKDGKTPSSDQLRDYIRRNSSLNPADKEKLMGEVDTLMEGMAVIRDPVISSAFKEGIGQDVDTFLKSPVNIGIIARNPNIASSVQSAYNSEIKKGVQASIEDGLGIPRGKAKLDLIDRAEAKAKERLASFKEETSKPPMKTKADVVSAPKKLKGKFEKQPDGTNKWIPE